MYDYVLCYIRAFDFGSDSCDFELVHLLPLSWIVHGYCGENASGRCLLIEIGYLHDCSLCMLSM